MGQLTEAFITIGMAIIGVAIVSTLVSKNANTAGVISAAGNAFGQDLGIAMGGVTGATYQGGPMQGMGSGVNFSPALNIRAY